VSVSLYLSPFMYANLTYHFGVLRKTNMTRLNKKKKLKKEIINVKFYIGLGNYKNFFA